MRQGQRFQSLAEFVLDHRVLEAQPLHFVQLDASERPSAHQRLRTSTSTLPSLPTRLLLPFDADDGAGHRAGLADGVLLHDDFDLLAAGLRSGCCAKVGLLFRLMAKLFRVRSIGSWLS